MTALTKCVGIDCEKRELCHRYTAEESQGQGYADFSPDLFSECDYFIDNRIYGDKM